MCLKGDKMLANHFFVSFILDMKDSHNDSKQACARWELAIFFNRVRGFNKFFFFFLVTWRGPERAHTCGKRSAHMWEERLYLMIDS